MGQLSESIARSYFEHLGYSVRQATPKEDAAKIDLICQKLETTVFVQVKSGEVSYKTIYECIKFISLHNKEQTKDYQVAFVARLFPPDLEVKRSSLETEAGCRIMFISSFDLARVLPEYRHSLS